MKKVVRWLYRWTPVVAMCLCLLGLLVIFSRLVIIGFWWVPFAAFGLLLACIGLGFLLECVGKWAGVE